MLAVNILAEVAEKPLTYDDNLLNRLSAADVKRLKSARATFRLAFYCVVCSGKSSDLSKRFDDTARTFIHISQAARSLIVGQLLITGLNVCLCKMFL